MTSVLLWFTIHARQVNFMNPPHFCQGFYAYMHNYAHRQIEVIVILAQLQLVLYMHIYAYTGKSVDMFEHA
jgi:hypothetical protein